MALLLCQSLLGLTLIPHKEFWVVPIKRIANRETEKRERVRERDMLAVWQQINQEPP